MDSDQIDAVAKFSELSGGDEKHTRTLMWLALMFNSGLRLRDSKLMDDLVLFGVHLGFDATILARATLLIHADDDDVAWAEQHALAAGHITKS